MSTSERMELELSLKETEAQVLAEGREWMRQRLQARLQAQAQAANASFPPSATAGPSAVVVLNDAHHAESCLLGKVPITQTISAYPSFAFPLAQTQSEAHLGMVFKLSAVAWEMARPRDRHPSTSARPSHP